MPYVIRKDGPDASKPWCVYTKGEGGSRHGCHESEAKAKAQQAALYVHAPDEAAKGDVVIHFGAAVKAMGEGKVGGYLIQYGGPESADADGEWFTPETDFDTEFPARVSVRYNHGMDPVLRQRRLAYGSIKQDDLGVWVEAQLDLRDRHQAAIYGLAAAGKMGWSSGAVAHFTDPPREAPGGAIKSWPGIAHDASLTPIPADRRNLAIALKSWDPPPLEELSGDGTTTGDLPPSLVEDLDRVADHAERVKARCAGIKAGTYQFSQSRRERIARLRDELSALLDETAPRMAMPEMVTEVSPPPGPGEGAPVEAAPPVRSTGALQDVNDLYTQACRQLDSCLLTIPTQGITGSPS